MADVGRRLAAIMFTDIVGYTRSPRISDPRQTGAKSCDSDRNDPPLSIRLSPEAR